MRTRAEINRQFARGHESAAERRGRRRLAGPQGRAGAEPCARRAGSVAFGRVRVFFRNCAGAFQHVDARPPSELGLSLRRSIAEGLGVIVGGGRPV